MFSTLAFIPFKCKYLHRLAMYSRSELLVAANSLEGIGYLSPS